MDLSFYSKSQKKGDKSTGILDDGTLTFIDLFNTM
jgi:hypothetical protein